MCETYFDCNGQELKAGDTVMVYADANSIGMVDRFIPLDVDDNMLFAVGPFVVVYFGIAEDSGRDEDRLICLDYDNSGDKWICNDVERM